MDPRDQQRNSSPKDHGQVPIPEGSPANSKGQDPQEGQPRNSTWGADELEMLRRAAKIAKKKAAAARQAAASNLHTPKTAKPVPSSDMPTGPGMTGSGSKSGSGSGSENASVSGSGSGLGSESASGLGSGSQAQGSHASHSQDALPQSSKSGEHNDETDANGKRHHSKNETPAWRRSSEPVVVEDNATVAQLVDLVCSLLRVPVYLLWDLPRQVVFKLLWKMLVSVVKGVGKPLTCFLVVACVVLKPLLDSIAGSAVVSPALRWMVGLLPLLGGQSMATGDNGVTFGLMTTIQTRCPYTHDMYANMGYLSAVSTDASNSGVARAFVDASLKRKSLVPSDMMRSGSGSGSGTGSSSLAFFLSNVTRNVDEINHRDGKFYQRFAKGILADYNKAQWLRVTMMGADKEQVAAQTTFTSKMMAQLPTGPVPWAGVRCWITGSSPAHRRLENRAATLRGILDHAMRTGFEEADSFSGSDSGKAQLVELADGIQEYVCRLHEPMVEAVEMGEIKLRGAQMAAVRGTSSIAESDLVALDRARDELRVMGAVGSTICVEARRTASGLKASHSVVDDFPETLKGLKERLEGLSGVGVGGESESRRRRRKCWDDDDVAEDELQLLGIVSELLKAMNEAYLLE
ncbi:hypothetical protein CH63R_14595 [Colletotrichum higginsianum IMI 349063]|uniref:Uncharacterized protein n=1 Tax=Colletotrichum higginsianum (strain IMI 349063) TaxID=759273 RepID=A0A1B7XQJ2_COLHI|nr:hypothetical protein CH63R_14595 [Colletotrichum higginsianum IMI 349063]OBR02023.1 hypothetical protein CH63R_14595 [Colletotrichum higginsianum IMI 349063]